MLHHILSIHLVILLFTDRSESAQILLNNKASATTRDVSGQICLSWMIVKMPPVVSFQSCTEITKIIARFCIDVKNVSV